MEIVIWLSFAILSLSLLLSFVRLLRGPSLPDRVVALELMASLTVGFIGVHAIASQRFAFLDVAMVLALTAFLAAVGFARFLEKRGIHADD
ncbi:monovalent cation/H+ antiporter complex subunit F [Alcanivorax sp. 1008]|uniref:monovalent cation/H+ antiporter complex subunit F n=1 Tax=Alcanivorax sp. 1008 TaxID=2816853 RepID=UPI001E123C73|nr:monovalent cation/H+ antiporter complex subunit F [Alcanivorax sp. 1008]MCC1496056.1 pH regulation protein F [Alcanivorax sp. 1008]